MKDSIRTITLKLVRICLMALGVWVFINGANTVRAQFYSMGSAAQTDSPIHLGDNYGETVSKLEQEISGTVVDAETGEPLPAVNVLVIGTSTGTTTNNSGEYTLSAPDDADSLRFSFIGYETTNIAIGGRTEIDVKLVPSVQQFNEMVVTAFGVEQEQRELGYSVQQVETEELNAGNNESLVSALQGKVSGVQVTNTGGAPGSSSRILIRGISSLDPDADNQPLFVVDGVPIDNSTITAVDTPRGLSNRAADINPDDIESVSVLKGAAAAALYGVRAANGAVIITTKKGEAGAVQINFNNSVGFDRVNKYPEFQKVYGQGFAGEATTDSFWPNWGAPIEAVADTVPGWQYYNIFRDAMETGVKIDNNISVSGGNELATYYGSVSNLMHDGVIPFSDWDRRSVRFSGDIQPNEDLKIASSVNFVNSGGNRVPADRFMERLMYWAPTKDVTDYRYTEGPLAGTMKGYYSDGQSGTNPIYDARYSTYEDNVNRVIGNINANYDFTDWFSASYRFGLDYYSDQRTNITPGPQGIEGENVLDSQGFINEYRINSRDLNSNLRLTLDRDLTEDINLNLTLGNDIFDRESNQVIASGDDFAMPNFYNLSNVRNVTNSQFMSQRRLIGAYGDLTIGYDDYLFLNVTGRNDWSSTLPVDNRSFFYPSFNLGFVFSDALDTPDYLSFGKLRASYAQVGKDANPYATGITFTSPEQYPLGGQVGYTRNQEIGSQDLKPEITTSIEVGADLRFIEDRIGLDFTWYKANSADQILTVPISNAAGATRLVTNAGEIENRGIELQLNLTPVQTPDLQWDVRFNYSRNRNEVISIREDLQSIFIDDSFGYAGGGASIQLVVGEPFGNIYGSSYARYFPEGEAPEDPLYVDEDTPILIGEDGFPVRNNEDLVLGNAFPDWIGGLYNQISYKDVSLSFLIDIQQEGSTQNIAEDDFIYGGDINKWVQLGFMLKARYLNHLSGRSSYAPADILTAVDNGMTGNEDDAQVAYYEEQRNPWAVVAINNAGLILGGWLSEQTVKHLDGTTYGVFDPRIEAFTDTVEGGGYLGTRNGAGRGAAPPAGARCVLTTNTYYAQTTAPILIATYAEQKFIEAEAAFRGGQTERAYQAYLAGIEAHMDKMGIEESAKSDYMTNPVVAVGESGLTLDLIFKEKYTAMYLHPEAWVDARRYDYQYEGMEVPANLNPQLSGQFIRRLVYPDSETQRNENVPEVTLLDRIFWDSDG